VSVSLHHVSIGVSDVDAAVEFYGWLGMTVIPTRPDFGFPGAWLQCGDRQVHLIGTEIVPPGTENHFALQVGDLDAVLAGLHDHGVKARRSAYTPGAGHQAFLRDPSGNVVELNEPDH